MRWICDCSGLILMDILQLGNLCAQLAHVLVWTRTIAWADSAVVKPPSYPPLWLAKRKDENHNTLNGVELSPIPVSPTGVALRQCGIPVTRKSFPRTGAERLLNRKAPDKHPELPS